MGSGKEPSPPHAVPLSLTFPLSPQVSFSAFPLSLSPTVPLFPTISLSQLFPSLSLQAQCKCTPFFFSSPFSFSVPFLPSCFWLCFPDRSVVCGLWCAAGGAGCFDCGMFGAGACLSSGSWFCPVLLSVLVWFWFRAVSDCSVSSAFHRRSPGQNKTSFSLSRNTAFRKVSTYRPQGVV